MNNRTEENTRNEVHPTWCERVGCYDDADNVLHYGFLVDDKPVAVSAAQSVTLTDSGVDASGVLLDLVYGGNIKVEALSAAAAREMASALLTAADKLDEINSEVK